MGGPDTPLCVYQLTQFTGASREPQSDRSGLYPSHVTLPTSNWGRLHNPTFWAHKNFWLGCRDQFIVHENPTHFTVMCKNQFYSVDVLHPDGSFVPESEIAKHLFAIKRHASSTHRYWTLPFSCKSIVFPFLDSNPSFPLGFRHVFVGLRPEHPDVPHSRLSSVFLVEVKFLTFLFF